jgi:hypothetical protein
MLKLYLGSNAAKSSLYPKFPANNKNKALIDRTAVIKLLKPKLV